MKINVSEATPLQLNWLVATGEGIEVSAWPDSIVALEDVQFFDIRAGEHCEFSTRWSQGGPIIEREGIATSFCNSAWEAQLNGYLGRGPTPLIAAMRCYVASKLDDEVDVPDELL